MSRPARIASLVIFMVGTSALACSTSQPTTPPGSESGEITTSEDKPKLEAPTEAEATEEVVNETKDPNVVHIEIDSDSIRVEGTKVVELVDGEVLGNQKLGGDTGMHIVPLVSRLEKVHQEMEKRGLFEGSLKEPTVEIRTSPLAPYRLVLEVMYSAGQVGFSRFPVSVEQTDGSVTRIDVHPPKLSELSGKDASNKLHITVVSLKDGFMVSAQRQSLSPVEKCPEQGPTICLLEPADNVLSITREARSAREEGNLDEAQRLAAKAVNAYDYRRLYNTLAQLKKKRPEELLARFSAEHEIPMAVVAKTTQVVRHKLPEGRYDDHTSFSNVSSGFDGNDALFPRIVFTIHH